MRNIIVLVCGILGGLFLTAQSPNAAQGTQYPGLSRGAVVNLREAPPTYRPMMQNLEAPHPGGNGYRDWLLKRKQELAANFVPQAAPTQKTVSTAPKPMMGSNFEGNNYFNGVPNDNDCAISDEGKLITVINSNIFVFDSSGSKLMDQSLHTFALALGLSDDEFDPKVTYDPKADRFILVCLNGFSSSNSSIIVGFSQTNDPTDNWNVYALPGNPNMDTTWSDYPIIAMTDKEFFITVNLLVDGQTWQAGFTQSLIWQLDKQNGYNGDTLSNTLWQNVFYGGKAIRNLFPVQSGSTTLGPDLWMVSNRNFATSNDSVFLIHVTDTIGAPNASVVTDVRLADIPYGMPPLARQKFNQYFATNDARWLGAFQENDKIQFVGNTVDPVTGRAALYHGTLDNLSSTQDVTGHIIGDSVLDFGYPNISYTGNSPGENGAIITYDYTSPDTFAGFGATFYDGNGGYSERLILKKGLNYINALSGATERWGDYSGSQRKYNEPGKVWVSGTWGRVDRSYGTWCAELAAPPAVSNEPILPRPSEAKVWPVPARDYIQVQFELEEAAMLQANIYSLDGRKLDQVWAGKAKTGTNLFRFTTEPLVAGTYLLLLEGESGFKLSRRVVVE